MRSKIFSSFESASSSLPDVLTCFGILSASVTSSVSGMARSSFESPSVFASSARTLSLVPAALELSSLCKASSFFSCIAAFSFSADSEIPSRCSDWREEATLSVCVRLSPARSFFGRDAQDTKKIDRKTAAVNDAFIDSRAKLEVRFTIINFEFRKP